MHHYEFETTFLEVYTFIYNCLIVDYCYIQSTNIDDVHIYETPAREESQLYVQMNKISIKSIPEHCIE